MKEEKDKKQQEFFNPEKKQKKNETHNKVFVPDTRERRDGPGGN